ncbi:nucleotide kinase domain-containing protein [Mycobacteroides abscessus]|uniref:nucleotide kinase domain-containing protein n=1 Tax=Mycobacteroides abscessus TaxID=36809 RepID=UPI000C25DA00|nr:nucleotide kinase domain-containing protein [Mycobacteroides abscessus]
MTATSVRPETITVAGRALRPTPVFDTYWRFASERQAIYEARLGEQGAPWTADPILANFRFTNCYRASDRVSQFLIQRVAYHGDQSAGETTFRVLLFKFFNRVSTWKLLENELGDLRWNNFDIDHFDQILSDAFDHGQRLYSAAYVIPPPRLGARRKHTNHLRLLRSMMDDDLPARLQDSPSMEHAFALLRSYPTMGDFLAFQMLIDLNYSTLLDFDEMDFVVAGPGARDGIRKCFGAEARGIERDVIRYMADAQGEHFARLGLDFAGLNGRPLQLIDCQNLFCEVDKYARVAHPEVNGLSGRSRIKQKFAPIMDRLTAWFPPKWGINALSESIYPVPHQEPAWI